MSTKDERLDEFTRAWRDADNNYNADILATGGDQKLIDLVEARWWQHQANWAVAKLSQLGKNSKAVEDAYSAAKTANDEIQRARQDAEKIIQLLDKSGRVVKSLAQLLKAVGAP